MTSRMIMTVDTESAYSEGEIQKAGECGREYFVESDDEIIPGSFRFEFISDVKEIDEMAKQKNAMWEGFVALSLEDRTMVIELIERLNK